MIRYIINVLSYAWEGKEYHPSNRRNNAVIIEYKDFIIITVIGFIFVLLLSIFFIGFMNPMEHVDAIT